MTAWWAGTKILEVRVHQDVGERCWKGGRRIPRKWLRYYIAERDIKNIFVVVMCVLGRWMHHSKNTKKWAWWPPSSHGRCGASHKAPRHSAESPHIALRAYVVKTKKLLFLLLIIAILVAARWQKVLHVRHQMWWLFGQSRASMAAAVAHIHSIWSL